MMQHATTFRQAAFNTKSAALAKAGVRNPVTRCSASNAPQGSSSKPQAVRIEPKHDSEGPSAVRAHVYVALRWLPACHVCYA